MERAHVFAEELEGCNTSGYFLDLVEEEEGLSDFNLYLLVDVDGVDNPGDVEIVEERLGKGVAHAVDIDDVLEFLPAQFFEDIGFPHLSGT